MKSLEEPPWKKQKYPLSKPTSTALSRLLSQVTVVSDLIAQLDIKGDTQYVLSQLALLDSRLDAFKSLDSREDEVIDIKDVYWRDILDSQGTMIWNKTTALRFSILDEDLISSQWSTVIAASNYHPSTFWSSFSDHLGMRWIVRVAGYNLISAGAIEPLSIKGLSFIPSKTRNAIDQIT